MGVGRRLETERRQRVALDVQQLDRRAVGAVEEHAGGELGVTLAAVLTRFQARRRCMRILLEEFRAVLHLGACDLDVGPSIGSAASAVPIVSGRASAVTSSAQFLIFKLNPPLLWDTRVRTPGSTIHISKSGETPFRRVIYHFCRCAAALLVRLPRHSQPARAPPEARHGINCSSQALQKHRPIAVKAYFASATLHWPKTTYAPSLSARATVRAPVLRSMSALLATVSIGVRTNERGLAARSDRTPCD